MKRIKRAILKLHPPRPLQAKNRYKHLIANILILFYINFFVSSRRVLPKK